MRKILVCSILTVGLAWAQHSIAAPAHAACEHPVKDFLQGLAGNVKNLGISPALTPKQYSFAKDEVRKHSKDHKSAPGDGAVVIDSDGVFMVVFTKGEGDAAKACAVAPVPTELVAAIVAIDAPPKVEAPETPKVDPERPWM